jgi:thiamine phosphate phosphatase / amino-HMP aminohydrolase
MDLVLDWDGTITTKGTLSVVASIGYKRNSSQILPPWSHFSEAYGSDYQMHAARHKAEGNNGISLEHFFAWQESLVGAERASVERVERAGIFANVTERDVDDAARRAVESRTVVLRPGLSSLLDKAHVRGSRITIVSVNWSGRFIHSCLRTAQELQHSPLHQDIHIRANDIESGSSSRLSRTFEKEDRGIWTAGDKARVMDEELKAGAEPRLSVYIGDTSTDLPCLLLADVGICLRDSELGSEQRSLQEILTELDIPCNWIEKYNISRDDGPGRRLWWARDFHEICNSALFQEDHQ